MNSRQVAAFSVAAVVAMHGISAQAQGLEIDHKAVGCIVVGKYPKLNACFSPASSLARSRVYFRPEGATSWYYVEMKSDQPCFAGILPRPGKKLVGKKIEYYVDAQDKTFNSSRTAEYGPVVVNSAQECKKDVPPAPFLNAANVAVFPALPAGFVGGAGLGAGAVLGIVGAGAAVAGTAVAVSNNNDNPTTTVAVIGGVTTTLPAPVTTTTTTTLAPSANQPPNAVFEAHPTSGVVPLNVHFDMCKTTDPDNDALLYKYDFGDGSSQPYSPQCFADHTYPNASSAKGAVRAQARDFAAELCVTDNHFERCRVLTISADTQCDRDKEDPTIEITNPADGSFFRDIDTMSTTVKASDDQGVRRVDYTLFGQDICYGYGAPFVPEQQHSSNVPPSYGVTFNLKPGFCGTKNYRIDAVVSDNCGKTSSTSTFFTVSTGCFSCFVRGTSRRGGQRIIWTSELSLEGRGQVVVNGAAAFAPGKGRSFAVSPIGSGENRVEAILVEGSGKPGTWRFELGGGDLVAPGSLKVVAGEVALITQNAVTFRLSGTPGERVAFTFQKK
jgi:Big-like domain-containing protein